jgi:hypothetical protein
VSEAALPFGPVRRLPGQGVRPEIDTHVRAVRLDSVSGPPHQVTGIHDQRVTPGKAPDLRIHLILCLEPDLVYPGIPPDGQVGADGLPRVSYQEGVLCVLGQEPPVSEGIDRFTALVGAENAALVGAENAAMAGLLRKMGACLVGRGPGTVEYEIALVIPPGDPGYDQMPQPVSQPC